jgi:imidazolonepropionase-like amidohydrolase
MQVIEATTRIAADCARVGHLTGTLEVGKRADVLGVDGDPLADITVLQIKERLALIMRDGHVFRSRVEGRGSRVARGETTPSRNDP